MATGQTPLVSVIVPNYNHARFLPKRLESILKQTYQDFELILLDDCSTDNSRSILSQYANDPRVRIEFNETNSGSPFKQWNKGVSLARGKYVWIAESDDYADERLLEVLVPLLDEDPHTSFAYARSWRVVDDVPSGEFADKYLDLIDPERWGQSFRLDGREACATYFAHTNPVPNASAVVFRKDVYERVGGADGTFRVCGDWKLWASMAMEGRIAYVGEALNYFRSHASTARSGSLSSGVNVSEIVEVIRWISERVEVRGAVPKNFYHHLADYWVPALMSLSVPVGRKRAILKEVRAIDPHPMKSAMVPALTTLQLKFKRHWHSLRQTVSPTAS